MKHLSTDPYKGTRDFFPEDMAVQRYIFDTWTKTVESFGFERYDASVLEPSDLYRSKGAQNEEMVNDQTYTFTDRGGREVTLRPEMTPTVARMIASKHKALSFPVRWYAIPNLFRYEKMQRGRLREFWQLNCDIFGSSHIASDVEIIALAHRLFIDFGANEKMFSIHINSRSLMHAQISKVLMSDDLFPTFLNLMDKKSKIDEATFTSEMKKICKNGVIPTISPDTYIENILHSLMRMGITNVHFDPTITRGFNYYTGLVFEVFDTSSENNRSMCGGGRFDNLTTLFSDDAISGVGFGVGDVIMRDFLQTHKLLPARYTETAPSIAILPMHDGLSLDAERIAHHFRSHHISSIVDLSGRKLPKMIGAAQDRGITHILILGDDEHASQQYTVKNMVTKSEQSGTLSELITHLT